jgi:hypothetical protein
MQQKALGKDQGHLHFLKNRGSTENAAEHAWLDRSSKRKLGFTSGYQFVGLVQAGAARSCCPVTGTFLFRIPLYKV